MLIRKFVVDCNVFDNLLCRRLI